MTSREPLSKSAMSHAITALDAGVASCHLDLSAYSADEIPNELRNECYGGNGLAGSDDYPEPE